MRRGIRRGVVAVGGTAAGLASAVLAERYAVRRARARPDPERGVPLSERPQSAVRIRSHDGTPLEVAVAGPPAGAETALLFVHGFTLDMTVWHYQWKRFSRTSRCVLFDQRGHGLSGEAGEDGYTLRALGRDIRAVLDQVVGQGPVVLVGHSMGGMAVMSFAEQFPEEFATRVRAVVLADTSASDLIREVVAGLGGRAAGLAARHSRRLVGALPVAHRLRSRALARRSGLAFLLARVTNFGPDAPPSLIDHVVSRASNARPEVWTGLMGSMVEMDLSHALERMAVPTLIVVGDVDRLTPQASAEAMRRRIADARVVVLRGAGHCAMLERHSQFNAVMARFLREVAPPQAGRADRVGP